MSLSRAFFFFLLLFEGAKNSTMETLAAKMHIDMEFNNRFFFSLSSRYIDVSIEKGTIDLTHAKEVCLAAFAMRSM